MTRATFAVAAAIILSAPAAAHDTGLDDLYTATDDDAHNCHHLRVQYWSSMAERARSEIWLMRYDHARPKESNSRLLDLRQKMARNQRAMLDLMREGIASLQRQAEASGCDPWS